MRKSAFAGALVASVALAAPAMANDSVVKCIADANNWCMQQGNYSATRYSELDQINTKNVSTPEGRLDLLDRRSAWPRGFAARRWQHNVAAHAVPEHRVRSEPR